MFSKHTKKKGFTMIEMLVGIFILVVLIGIILANFKQGGRNDDLRRSVAEVTSVLRKAQNLSLIGSQQNLPSGMSNNTGIFGVHFALAQPTKYLLFLDFKNAAGQNVSDGLYQSGEELPNSTYDLPLNTTLSVLNPNSGNVLDITFSPPKPTIYFNGVATATLAEIKVYQASTNNSKFVRVNRISGQINITNQ